MSFSVCPRTQVVPYGWHRFWLIHAYFIYVQIARLRQSEAKKNPDIYDNLDKWDIYVRGSWGAYMYLQQGSPVLRIPQRMFFIYISYYISGILFYPVVAWYMHTKHVKYAFVDKKIIDPQWHIVRTGTSSERYNTFSNIPRSDNAPSLFHTDFIDINYMMYLEYLFSF